MLKWQANIIGNTWGIRAKNNKVEGPPEGAIEHFWKATGEVWVALCDMTMIAKPQDRFSRFPILGLWIEEVRDEAQQCSDCAKRRDEILARWPHLITCEGRGS